MTENELRILIQRYFEGETSLNEEKQLRRLLADNPYPELAEAEEARAVMAFSNVAPKATATAEHQRKATSKKSSVWWNCAAAAVIIALMTIPITHTFNQSGECVAYVNGIKTEDVATVTAMMLTELEEAAKASDRIESGLTSEWAQMSDAFNSLN